jgi:hypothetical protein
MWHFDSDYHADREKLALPTPDWARVVRYPTAIGGSLARLTESRYRQEATPFDISGSVRNGGDARAVRVCAVLSLR